MESMSAQDAAFLHIEDGNNPMHIGSVAVLEGPAPRYGDLVRLIAATAGMKALGYTRFWGIAMVPLRDLFGLAVWAAGIGGREVEWRGLRYRLLTGGRIKPL